MLRKLRPSNTTRLEEELTAEGVKQEYLLKIEEFLRKVDGHKFSLLRQPEYSLQGLFAWGEKVLGEKSKLEKDLRSRNSEYNTIKKERDEFKEQFKKVLSKNEAMEVQHSAKIVQLKMWYGGKLAETERKYKDSQTQHHNTIESLKEDHKNLIHNLKQQHYDSEVQHERYVERLNQDHEIRFKSLQMHHDSTVSKLKGQLLVNQSDFKGWPDDKLRMKFKELQGSIDLITAPQKQELTIPRDKKLGQSLDPSRFLARAGNENAHFLLKSRVWSIIYEHFFSLPFGFGVLGPDSTQNPLLQVFNLWYMNIEGHEPHATPSVADLMIFRTNKAANEWRSATFQSAISVVTRDENSKLSENSIANLSDSNVEQVIRLINAMFVQITGASNGSLQVEVEDEIRQAIKLAREIAFQFGIHPAHLRLLRPAHGESVEIGKEYQDCCDGDYNKGKIYTVDLVTVPGLQKIGDGRSDMSSTLTIVPCEIYPNEV